MNLPSHGHGQGWADLNFLIPELVDSVRFRKGPYAADKGDFSIAGGVDMQLVGSLPQPIVTLTGGSYDYGRLLVADSRRLASGDFTAAVDLSNNDGPWARANDYQGAKALLRYVAGDAGRGFSLTAMAYDASWLSTDQVPRRAVAAGLIDRFGLLDPDDRGSSSRYSLSAEAHRATAAALTSVSGYLVYSDLDLVSNFTYYLDDPASGDGFTQYDQRLVAGFDANRSWVGSWGEGRMESAVGLQLRADDVDNGLFRTGDPARAARVREDSIFQLTGGPYAETLVHWSDKVRTRLGLRGDLYYADVRSDLDVNSGSADAVLLSPKLSVALGPWNRTDVYVNVGYGYHSNDARGATIRVDPATGEAARRVPPLVRGRGADIGVRTTRVPGLQSTLSLFVLELDSELIFLGDAGSTEAGRPSRRMGIEWSNFYRLGDWVSIDLDATLADAEFTDRDPAGRRIPGALEKTVAAGVSVGEGKRVFGSLRWRYFGDAPLIEDGSVRSGSSSLLNGRIGYSFARGLTLELDAFNLLDREDNEIEYYYVSRLQGEPEGGVPDIHFHPFEPHSARLVVKWRR